MKTKELNGTKVSVYYFDGQIFAAAKIGKVTMNESLGIIKEFAGTRTEIRSVCGNATYLAICDYGGSVRYYKKEFDKESKVIL